MPDLHVTTARFFTRSSRLSRTWLVGAFVGLLFFVSHAKAEDQSLAPATLKAVKRSTVYLRVTFDDESTAEGSGFFAGQDNMILTNAHVVGMKKNDGKFPQRIDVVVNSGQEDERSYLGQVVGADSDLDLAVVRVEGDQLPPPLKVVAGRNLEETQTVYIFGFPLGRDLGKDITVSKSSISSLRKNDAGVLERIQVNGGMHPGNSGGPVVDAKGQVVGAAVAAVRNTQLHFAVPGDSIRDFLDGRIASISVGKPRQSEGKLTAVIRVRLSDPLKRIHSVSIDYWLGARGKPRPSSVTLPDAVKGDTPRRSLPLKIADGVAEGKWTIPLPAAGQVLWAQPCYTTESHEKRWATAVILRPAPPEDDAAELPANPAKNTVGEDERAAAVEKDLKTLEGTWKLVRREVSGGLEDVDDLKLAVVIEDGKMIWTKAEKDTGLKASIDLDATAAPRTIDIELIGPRLLGEQRLGVYKIQGDKLELCWNKADDKRPKKFTTRLSVGCGTVLETYRRVPD
jgi:uncharacterized protein (TIGR03067 family)